MYHFIRRFFIFVLVFACCFILPCTGTPQWGVSPQLPSDPSLAHWDAMGSYASPGLTSSYGMGSYASGWASSNGMGYVGGGLASTLVMGQRSYALDMFQQGAALPSYVLIPSQIDGTPFSGVASSIMDRTGLALGTSKQQYMPNMVSQTYIPRDTKGAYGSPGIATVDYSTYHPFYTHFDTGNPYSDVIPSMTFAASGFHVPTPWRYDSAGYGNMGGLWSWGYGYTAYPSYVGYEVPLAYF